MHTVDHLGVASTGYMCSGTTCQGTNQAAQHAFIALQTEINRLGRVYGTSRIDVDGKLGPTTLRAIVTLAERIFDRLTVNTDGALRDLLLEIDDRNATTVRDLAEKAEVLTAALQRDGMAQAPRSIYTAVRNQMQQIIDVDTYGPGAGGAPAVPNPPTFPGGGNSLTPQGFDPANPWPVPTGPGPSQSASPAIVSRFPASWKVWAGVGAAALAIVGAGLWYGRRLSRRDTRRDAA